MTDINADQKARAKTAAANAAVAANDMAVALGAVGAAAVVAGVASGVGALAGVVTGGTLAVGSFAAWWVGNRYQRLANDPPRSDFNKVTESNAQLDEVSVPQEEPLATVYRFAAHQIILIDALDALVTSLERYDGAIEAQDFTAADRQAKAVSRNAEIVISEREILNGLVEGLNMAWNLTLPLIDWDSLSVDKIIQVYLQAVGQNPGSAPSDSLTVILSSVTGLQPSLLSSVEFDANPLLELVQMPDKPAVIFDSETLENLTFAATVLSNLAIDGVA